MKRVFLSLLFVLCIVLNLNSFVFAADKEYSFDSVDFLVQLNSDGSADIKETWIVDYKKGEFSRFYKNIYLDVLKEEVFTKIGNWEVFVDGTPCNYTTDSNSRPNYHYTLIDNGDTLTYEVYVASENQTLFFEINYTLYDVVKYVDNDYYLFTYRFLPDEYKNNVGSKGTILFNKITLR